ncbi:MAG: hypothetical protein RLZZ28_1067 [Bacteroidota bacterium]|jgi:RES domain-containing protein
MTLYRFAHKKHAAALDGTGARLFGGRWNPVGISCIYTSAHISLALLEILANAQTLEELQSIRLMEIQLPATIAIGEVKLKSLKKDWQQDIDYTQWLGKEIIQSNELPVFSIPSAIVPNENNFILNPLHPDFKKIKLTHQNDFHFDERLFRHSAIN